MTGKIQSYETIGVKKGPKNTLLGVKEVPLLMWQITDRKGAIHTELGFELKPGVVRKLPSDLMKKSGVVNEKLQRMLIQQLHPELAEANGEKPEAAPQGRVPKEVAVSKLPKDIDAVGDAP